MNDIPNHADQPEPDLPQRAIQAEVIPPQVPIGPVIEPPVASRLAVWAWILAVFAFLPLVGVVPAVALAACSLVLLARGGRYPWDRRVGVAGMTLSLAAIAVLGVWVIQVVVSEPRDFPVPEGFDVPAKPSRQVAVVQIVVLVASIVLHECAHGVAAYWSGDGTAARQGRIRLNPLAHVDPFGSVILPAVLVLTSAGVVFGWAKPVPINPRQFRHPRRGLLGVTLAGVSINLLLALACTAGLLGVGSVLRLAYPTASSEGFALIFKEVKLQGVAGAAGWQLAITALKQGILVNLVLFTFNIIPVPPLDGYGVLESLAPVALSRRLTALRPAGALVLIALIVLGAISYLLVPAVLIGFVLNFLVGVLTGWG